jgi:hypothetical protein
VSRLLLHFAAAGDELEQMPIKVIARVVGRTP